MTRKKPCGVIVNHRDEIPPTSTLYELLPLQDVLDVYRASM